MSQPQPLEERECVERCKCKEHGELVCAALTKREVVDVDLCAYLHHICCSCESVKDEVGRTALHVAVSCGRMDVVKWLLRIKHANINAKDYESGYTPLHRSIFYGKLNVAVYLIKLGANLTLTDFNGLTSLEHAMKDCIGSSYLHDVNQGEVYVWGSNTNYTLGPQQARSVPELLDAYHKQYSNLYVQQVCLEKFHCVLVSTDGRVFACGHGQGGRLGLSSEKTVIAPEQVKLTASGHANPVCKKASIAIDHSVFLTESGHVWTCGLNTHRVLGIQPPPAQILTPTPLSLMQYPIENICAARYHTVAWGPKAIYSWGLHGGQLGHDKTIQKYIISPKLVTCLHGLGCTIIAVAASNGATAIVTSKGDIYVLHEYQCRKIASKQLDIVSVSVVGGKLNDKIDNSLSTEENHELVVVGLSKVGNLYIWKESDPTFARCIFSINRFLKIHQVTLNLNEILFVTHQGEAFQGILKPRKRKTTESSLNSSRKSAFHEFLEKDNCQLLKVTKIPRVHRAVSIHSDLKGRNYAVLQASPKAFLTKVPDISQSNMQEDMYLLLQDASEDDQIVDVIFKVSSRFFPVHRYIIAFSSNKLSNVITASEDKIIELSNVNEDIFEQLLLFIYTGTCDLLKVGKCPNKFQLLCKKAKKKGDLEEQCERIADVHISAFEYYKNERSKPKASQSNNSNDGGKDPVRMLHEASKRFGVKTLQKILDNIYYENGFILTKKEKRLFVQHKFDRNQFTELQDITLKTKEGKKISAHKCILACRLEYFNNLFSSRWNMDSPTKEISLPFPHNVLYQLIEFLYTDELPLLENEDIDHVCNLLVLADQLFVLRLREICESTLSTFVTLKNGVQMLSFASLYNANQLKVYCMEFVCANLAAVLESRSLEMVDDVLLHELTDFYCEYNSFMQQRIITPYSYAPSDEVVFAAGGVHHIVIEDSDGESEIKNTPKTQKKRSRARKSTDNNNRKERSISDSLETSNNIVDLVNESSTRIKPKTVAEVEDKWSSDDHSNVVRTRLRAIAFAQGITDCDNIETNYIKLPLKPSTVEVSLDDFPELDSHHSTGLYSKSPSNKEKIDVKHKITRLSQKQRKRLSSESNSLSNTFEPCSPKLSESPKNPWKICSEIANSVSPVGSPRTTVTMDSIITDEKRQKENLVKMRTKLLVHTQMEDKAIEDLYKFYNVDNVFDEIVTINRVQMGLVASPVWVNLNKTK